MGDRVLFSLFIKKEYTFHAHIHEKKDRSLFYVFPRKREVKREGECLVIRLFYPYLLAVFCIMITIIIQFDACAHHLKERKWWMDTKP